MRRRREDKELWETGAEDDARRAYARGDYPGPPADRGFSEARASIERRWSERRGLGNAMDIEKPDPSRYPLDSEHPGFTGIEGPEGAGPYSGVGPKGYRRSDDRIREDVADRLTQDGWVDAGDIDIEVKEGEVYLTGSVETRGQKRRAEDIAASVAGAQDVHNRLQRRR